MERKGQMVANTEQSSIRIDGSTRFEVGLRNVLSHTVRGPDGVRLNKAVKQKIRKVFKGEPPKGQDRKKI